MPPSPPGGVWPRPPKLPGGENPEGLLAELLSDDAPSFFATIFWRSPNGLCFFGDGDSCRLGDRSFVTISLTGFSGAGTSNSARTESRCPSVIVTTLGPRNFVGAPETSIV